MKIVILGGGISGLSAAWYLRKAYPDAKITLLEKESSLGGRIETVQNEEFFFEKGPRTFLVSRSKALLELIEEVGLKDEIIFSDKNASKRYLWHGNKLRSMISFLPRFFPVLIREPFIQTKAGRDESIYDFALRRFSKKVAETFFDPMALGVFAGDIRHLSLKSCFPFLHQWEQEKGSVLRGFFSRKKGPQGLFTLKRGMGSLVEAIVKQLPVEIVVNAPVKSIEKNGVYTRQILKREKGSFATGPRERFWSADWIISALPAPTICRLAHSWLDFSSVSLWVVSCVFPENSLSKKGFGYLVPTQEKEPMLGAIWDSSIFPQQNKNKEVRLTVMIRDHGDAIWARDTALESLKRHLKIQAKPLYIEPHFMQEAIPQFEIGYAENLNRFKKEIKEKYPSLFLIGNYISGASVDSCIQTAKKCSRFEFLIDRCN